ncbi:hypothetical protein GCM10009648_21240 [Tsukamurella spumae]
MMQTLRCASDTVVDVEETELSWSTYGDSVAFRVSTLRRGLGITQFELAERSGVSRSEIQVIEYNRGPRRGEFANPTLQTIYRIAMGLGVHPIDLLPDAYRAIEPRSPEQATNAARSLIEDLLVDRLRLLMGHGAE